MASWDTRSSQKRINLRAMSVDFNYISKKKKNVLICRALIPLMINESIYVWVVYIRGMEEGL